MKNRTVIGIFCILLSVGVAFGIAPFINQTAAARTDVVRVTRDISHGSRITENDVEIVSVGAHNLPSNVIKKTEDVVGKFAATDLKADMYLLPSKISDTADSAYDVFKTLDGSKQAMSITIGSFAGGVSGKLKNGDIVSVIIACKNPGTPAVIPAELKYVRVITTTTSSGYQADNPNEEGNEMPSTVTLIVNDEQSRLLAEFENNAVIHLAFVFRGDEGTANQFITAQDEYFENRVIDDDTEETENKEES